MDTKNYLESTENHLSSGGEYFRRTHHNGNSARDTDKNDSS